MNEQATSEPQETPQTARPRLSDELGPVKTCRTCGHRSGNICMLSGHYTTTERKCPTECGRDFDGWVKRAGIKEKISAWWNGPNM